ncbi:Protein of unknown function [Cotesia congregata]|uniref:Uncharacterized protein n=1 Tax=Cotesia congregata TaxID=51543 RepID=A0A8J2H5Q6_COTCN|nr:Protein of unknown function [Cotesia congregata]
MAEAREPSLGSRLVHHIMAEAKEPKPWLVQRLPEPGPKGWKPSYGLNFRTDTEGLSAIYSNLLSKYKM